MLRRHWLMILVIGFLLLLTACPGTETKVAAPKNVAAGLLGESIIVSWQYSGSVDRFEIYRDPGLSSSGLTTAALELIDTAQGSERRYEDSSVTPGESYSYAVVAVQDGNKSARAAQTNDPVEVPAENTAPVATNDTYPVNAGETLTVNAANGVLKNDTDSDGDGLTAVLVTGSGPAHGIVTLNPNGSFTYQHDGGADSSDSFTYKANDGQADSAEATVTIEVIQTGENNPPVAEPDSYKAVVNTPLNAGTSPTTAARVLASSVLANDSDADDDELSVTFDSSSITATQGSFDGDSSGSFSFVPALNFVGTVNFSYTVSDGAANDTATVTISMVDANGVAGGSAKLFYIDDGAAAGGNGSASQPFNSLTSLGSDGDMLFVFSGTYPASGDHNIDLKPSQKLMGQGVVLSISGISGNLVEAASSPALSGAAASSIVLDNNVTIKGLTIDTPISHGISGTDKLTGTLLLEDITIHNSGKSGVFFTESNKEPGSGELHDLILRRVHIINPGSVGILSNDAKSFTVEDSSVEELVVNLSDSSGLSGRGIQAESEFNTSISISNTTISFGAAAPEGKSLLGFLIRKNNSYTHHDTITTLTADLSSTQVINTHATARTKAYQFDAVENDAADPHFEGPDTGNFNLQGTNNAATLTSFEMVFSIAKRLTTCTSSLQINAETIPCN